jgi:hypothetical protein
LIRPQYFFSIFNVRNQTKKIDLIMKKFTFLFLMVFICIHAFCQENFIPGIVIKLNGDTTHGFIDYRNWRVNPLEITFKASADALPVVYKPAHIKGFEVSDKIYESALVLVETSPVNSQDLNTDGSFRYRSDSLFLKARFRGTKSLYHCVTSDYKDQFYIRTDTAFELLAYKKYLVETDNYSQIYNAENKKFINQLSTYLSACPTLGYKIENARYNKESMDRIFQEYSKCTGEKYNFIRKKEQKRTEFGLMAGMSMTKVNFKGSDYPYLVEVDYGISNNFTFGLVFDYIQVKSDKKWSVSNELIITVYSIAGNYMVYEDEKNYVNTYVDISYSYIKWHPLFRYKFPVGKMFLFANAGPSFGMGGERNNTITQYIKISGIDRTRTDVALEYTRNFEFGAVGGFGARIHHFTLEARYEWGNGFSSESNLTSSTNRLYFLLGYRF